MAQFVHGGRVPVLGRSVDPCQTLCIVDGHAVAAVKHECAEQEHSLYRVLGDRRVKPESALRNDCGWPGVSQHPPCQIQLRLDLAALDRKSTRLNSSH